MQDSIYKGKIKAVTFENLCDFHLNFDYDFKNIISIGSLYGEGVLECEELYSFGNINIDEINAEVVYIHPDSNSKVKQVMGSDIRITKNFLIDQTFLSLPKSADNKIYKKEAAKPASIMELDSIEGDDIVLDHVHAKYVTGEHVVIGDYCVIDCVEYKNDIEVSSKSTVKNKIKI
jgi:cytoskeletal protein CcmA (bactofilin family)